MASLANVWRLPEATDRRLWLKTTGADRMRRLRDIAGEYGRPWWTKWSESVDANWYRQYHENVVNE